MAWLKQNVNPIKTEKIKKSLLYSKTDQHDTQNSIINRKDLNPNDITPKQGSYLYNTPKYGIPLKSACIENHNRFLGVLPFKGHAFHIS